MVTVEQRSSRWSVGDETQMIVLNEELEPVWLTWGTHTHNLKEREKGRKTATIVKHNPEKLRLTTKDAEDRSEQRRGTSVADPSWAFTRGIRSLKEI